jgi:hypothetical protein
MFLIGGPAYSGTTLLTHLLNQDRVTCLDEPDFHNLKQSHQGMLYLKDLFPDKSFPGIPSRELTYREAVSLIQECEMIISPQNLGFKTCDWPFIEYAKIYKELGYPVIAIIRDIRDALVTPVPPWVKGEEGLNRRYRLIWRNLELFDLWFKYEDLVMDTEEVIKRISRVLSYDFKVLQAWDPNSVVRHTLWEKRHHLLKVGHISKSRIGIWKISKKNFSKESHETALMMGY